MITLLTAIEAFCMIHPKDINLLKKFKYWQIPVSCPAVDTCASDFCFAILLIFACWSTL